MASVNVVLMAELAVVVVVVVVIVVVRRRWGGGEVQHLSICFCTTSSDGEVLRHHTQQNMHVQEVSGMNRHTWCTCVQIG